MSTNKRDDLALDAGIQAATQALDTIAQQRDQEGDRFQRARVAFDELSAMSYYGGSFREALFQDIRLLTLAEMLASYLKAASPILKAAAERK